MIVDDIGPALTRIYIDENAFAKYESFDSLTDLIIKCGRGRRYLSVTVMTHLDTQWHRYLRLFLYHGPVVSMHAFQAPTRVRAT